MSAKKGMGKTKSKKDDSIGIGCGLIHLGIFIIIPIVMYFFGPKDESLSNRKNCWPPSSCDNLTEFVENEYHPQLKEKVVELNQITKSLNDILYFVEYQKEKLENEDKILSELIQKNEELGLVVNTKIEIVEALFKAQEDRNEKSRIRNWYYAFLLGIISSITATIIWRVINYYYKKNRSNL